MTETFEFEHDDEYPALRERAMSTTVKKQTLVATTYPNHFTEVMIKP